MDHYNEPEAVAPGPSKLARAAEGKQEMVRAYLARHAAGKMVHRDYCYRHHPDHSNLLPDKYTMQKLQSELEGLPKEDCEVISHMWNLFGSASGRQRQIILRGMLSQCCFPQLSDVATTTRDLLRIDFIASLPIELSFKILGFLDAKSLCMASMVSKTWMRLANDDVVWYHMCAQHIDRKCTTCGWGLPLLERRRLKKSKQAVMQRLESLTTRDESARNSPAPEYNPTPGKRGYDAVRDAIRDAQGLQNQLEGSKRLKREHDIGDGADKASVDNLKAGSLTLQQSQPVTRPWKDVYIERFKIERNWRLGKYKVKDFKHPSPVLCLQFDEQYLMTGSCDGTVSIWDVETKQLIRELTGHIRGVSALKFDATKLVTGSWDQSVRVWNYRTGQCLCTFGGHESKVLCIDFDSNLIAAGSQDATIKIWDFVTKSCFTLRGHRGAVHSVRIHKASNTLFTSSEDLTVRMWCLSAKKCIRVFGGPGNGPLAHIDKIQYALPLSLEHLEGESEHDHHIQTYTETSGSDNTEDDSSGGMPNHPRQATVHPSSSIGDEVAAYIRSSEEAHEDADEENPARRPTHLLTASLDNTIKLWDIKTGRCARTLFGHIEGVWCIAADHFRIVSGAQDKLVKVWDVQSGKCWHTFSGHTKPVCCVGLTDTGFASGGDDGLVKLYSFD